MTNTVLIKRSGTANAVPLAANLALGELAINYADGNLFYKNSSGTVTVIASNQFSSVTGNVTGGNINTGGIVSAVGKVYGLELTSTQSSGDEGGQLNLALAATNTTLSGNVIVDVFQNKLRFFEGGGTNRGAYIDLTAAGAGVSTNLLAGSGTPGGSNTYVQFNDAGAFGGNASFTYDKVLNTVTAGTFAGTLNGSGQNFKVGDDAWIGDINAADTIGLKGQQNAANAYIVFGNSDATGKLGRSGTGPLTYAGAFSATGNVNGGNLISSALVEGVTVSASGNMIGGNVTTAGLISATGNITGNRVAVAAGTAAAPSVQFSNDIAADTGFYWVSDGNIGVTTNGTLRATFLDTGFSVVGNVTSGNLLTAGLISATGNITGGNILGGANVNATTHTGTTVSVSANITGGNLLTSGIISATGNVSGGNVAAATAIFSLGTVGASGNTSGGNLTTGGQVSATGNITGGNLLTGGLISATGNVTAGNIIGTIATASQTNITGVGTLTAGTWNANTIGLAYGGTGATSAPAAMASLMGYTSTVTAAGTTTLTNTSSYYQQFTGSTTQTVVLPVTSTLTTGWTFHIVNNSTGSVTVQSSGLNTVITVIAGTTAMVTCIGTALTTAADWEAGLTDFSTYTGSGSVVLSASPTFSGTVATSALSSTSTISLIGSTTSVTLLGTAATSGTTTIGGLLQTGAINLGRSTATQTIAIGNGITSSGNTKTIDIGTLGAANSITNINIGTNAGNGNATFSANTLVVIANTGSAALSVVGNITGGNLISAALVQGVTVSASGNVIGGNVNTNTLNGTNTTVKSAGNINLSATGNIILSTATYINNVSDPTQAQDAATKNYVDSVAQGLDVKASVNYATAAALPAYTYNNGSSGVGATITITATGTLSIDGQVTALNERILVKNETSTNAPYNGIYYVSTAGAVGVAAVLTRALDFNAPAEMYSAFTFVEFGDTLADTGWVCTNNSASPITVGTTNITFSQFSGAGTYQAGTGLTLTGTTFSVNASQTQITTVGTLGSLTVTGNTSSGNLLTGGLISATGNITGGNILGGANVNATTHTGTTVSVTGNVNGGNLISAALVQGVTVSASGNVIGGNVTTAGLISATGNITGGNILGGANVNATTHTGTTVSVTGNVNGGNLISSALIEGVTVSASGNMIGGNVTTAGLISATGNITGGNILGGANVNATTHTGTTVSVSANITGGNLLTSGLISATSNITGGNLISAALVQGVTVSASGNVVGGNVTTAGLISATGNVTSGNILTAGLISATGNVSGNYFIGNGSQLTGINSGGNLWVVGRIATYYVPIINSILNIVGRTGNISVPINT